MKSKTKNNSMQPENFTTVYDVVCYKMLTSLSALCHMEKFVSGMTVILTLVNANET
jgi:hypothetical protein